MLRLSMPFRFTLCFLRLCSHLHVLSPTNIKKCPDKWQIRAGVAIATLYVRCVYIVTDALLVWLFCMCASASPLRAKMLYGNSAESLDAIGKHFIKNNPWCHGETRIKQKQPPIHFLCETMLANEVPRHWANISSIRHKGWGLSATLSCRPLCTLSVSSSWVYVQMAVSNVPTPNHAHLAIL